MKKATLLWVDLEMTGLVPGKDKILEVAAIGTDWDLAPICEYTGVVKDDGFDIPYSDRFEEGEFRKRIPFMWTGKLKTERFIYKGSDINAVLDRLPTAVAKEQKDGTWKVSAEVFGEIGYQMWVRSQGDNISMI